MTNESTRTTTARDDTTPEALESIVEKAAEASAVGARTPRAERARTLRTVADHLDAAADALIPIAERETHLAHGRLSGELKRTTFQLRLFGEVVEEGGYLDARVDHADPAWPMGPRPDLRRILVPIGPVIVYAASNFPFAFSVAGGDTASALAAGNAVIVKAHPGHPELSSATAEVVVGALRDAGAPDGLFALVTGLDAGIAILRDPRIKAGSFTGSIPGGRALFDIAQGREEPIPFYGELGSTNPTIVTRGAAAARPEAIAREFVASFTLGAGQFCTKPGLLYVPADSPLSALLAEVELPGPAKLLNDRIQHGYAERLESLRAHAAVDDLRVGPGAVADPPTPTLLRTTIDELIADPDAVGGEVFGPEALVVTYDDDAQLARSIETLGGQLTATIIGEPDDAIAPTLVEALAKQAGRVLWNEWPTGVSVTYAQQHGGPYPATTASGTTSVGTAAITRFLRPVAYQNLPQALLPDALRDVPEHPVPRRVEGRLVLG